MANNTGMVQAKSLRKQDVIQVPVEDCQIIGVRVVPGQLKNRNNYLLEMKVIPLSGPWANCEGIFIIESGDLVPLVRKFRESKLSKFSRFIRSVYSRFFPAREGVRALPNKPVPVTIDNYT